MTTDNARAEAERRYSPWGPLGLTYGQATDIQNFFVAGAEWQASRTPVVADREALAAIRERDANDWHWNGRGPRWGQVEQDRRDLLSALAPAPVVADVDAIARVLAEHSIKRPAPWREHDAPWTASWRCWACEWLGDSSGHARHQAEQVAALLRGE